MHAHFVPSQGTWTIYLGTIFICLTPFQWLPDFLLHSKFERWGEAILKRNIPPRILPHKIQKNLLGKIFYFTWPELASGTCQRNLTKGRDLWLMYVIKAFFSIPSSNTDSKRRLMGGFIAFWRFSLPCVEKKKNRTIPVVSSPLISRTALYAVPKKMLDRSRLTPSGLGTCYHMQDSGRKWETSQD